MLDSFRLRSTLADTLHQFFFVGRDWEAYPSRRSSDPRVQSCRENSNVRSIEKPKSAAYCGGVLQEGQRRYSATDYGVLNRLAAEDPIQNC